MQKDYKDYIMKHKKERERLIVHTSLIGIVGSTILAIFEIIVGFLSNSIAIILDGIETISTAVGSIVIIITIKLSNKPPDKKHPMGYGRIEYVSDMIVASIIIYIGLTAFMTELKAIIYGRVPNYTTATYIVLVVSMITKFLLGLHERKVGKKVHSKSLSITAFDSFYNSTLSMLIIISALIYSKTGTNLENYLGLVIAMFIFRVGLKIFVDTLTEVLGKKVQSKLVDDIKKTMINFDDVRGVYDFVLHSYGRDKYIGSVHIEVDSEIDVLELERLQRRITERVYIVHGVVITAIGIYAINTKDEDFMKIYNYINTFVKNYRDVEEVHGLYVDKEKKEIYFDIVLDCMVENKDAMINAFKLEIEEEYRDYTVTIQRDIPIE